MKKEQIQQLIDSARRLNLSIGSEIADLEQRARNLLKLSNDADEVINKLSQLLEKPADVSIVDLAIAIGPIADALKNLPTEKGEPASLLAKEERVTLSPFMIRLLNRGYAGGAEFPISLAELFERGWGDDWRELPLRELNGGRNNSSVDADLCQGQNSTIVKWILVGMTAMDYIIKLGPSDRRVMTQARNALKNVGGKERWKLIKEHLSGLLAEHLGE